MALADIVHRIEKDAATEVAAILQEAEEAATATRTEAQERADASKQQIVTHATREAEAAARTRLAIARLAARDNTLGAKRRLVERVIAEVVAHLESLPAEEYAAFIAHEVTQVIQDGETLSVGHEDHGRLGVHLRSALVAAGANVVVRGTTAALDRGVVIMGDRVKVEVSARSLVTSRRDRLVAVVSSALFGESGRGSHAARNHGTEEAM